MNVVYKFGLDVQEIGSQVYLAIKQGDTARQLRIYLTEGYEPYIIEEGEMPVLAASKPDGTELFNDCAIDANEIIYDFTEQTVAAVGKVKCELRLYKNGEVLVSPNFTIEVQEGALGDAQIQSLPEVNTLTGLINEATTLIEDVNADLESGVFVPELEIGIVETLPTGANATASITGTGKNPVLNLGLPRGPIGTADGLVVDAEVSKDSTNPIQNRPVAEEFETVRAEQQEYAQGVAEAFAAVEEALGNKVDKAAGKGLSTNDFTTAEKQKLAGIEAGANKFVLADGAVTRAKLANDALYSPTRAVSGDHTLSNINIGETFRSGSRNAAYNIIITEEASTAWPMYADFAVFRYGKENGGEVTVTFAPGLNVCAQGWEDYMSGGITIRLPLSYQTVAFKKVTSLNMWYVIGEVEVVA